MSAGPILLGCPAEDESFCVGSGGVCPVDRTVAGLDTVARPAGDAAKGRER